MSDDPTNLPGDAPGREPADERDPGLAALLDVEPLDEATRARLVRTALQAADDRSEPDATVDVPDSEHRSRRRAVRLLAVAAALVTVVVVSIALVTRGSDEPHPTALAPKSSAAERAPSALAPESGSAAADTAANLPVPSFGDLGEIGTSATLRRGVARAEPAGTTTPLACASAAATRIGTPVGAGTGTVKGQPATVIVVKRPNGDRRAVVVIDATCAASPAVDL